MFFSGSLKTTLSEQSGTQAASTTEAKLNFDSYSIITNKSLKKSFI